MKHTLIVLAALAIVGFPLIGRAGDDDALDELELRLRLQEGDKYTITTTTEKTEGHWFQQTESTQTATTSMWLTMEVLTVKEDGTAKVKLTFDRITYAADGPMGSIEYDSQDGDEEELEFPLSIYQAVIGKSYRAKLSPTAKVLKVLDTMPLHLAITGVLPANSRVTLTSPSGMEALKLLDTGHIKQIAASVFFPCPDAAVATGGTWAVEGKLSGDPPSTCDITYTLASRQDGVATIQVEGDAKYDPNVRTGNAVVITNTEGELEGTRKGAVTLDEASGMIVDSRITTSLGGEMKQQVTVSTDADADGDDDDAQEEEMTIPQTIDTIVTVKCEKQT